jgi:hypothetical protein
VLQGVNVPRTGVSKQYQLKLNPSDSAKQWKTQIVMSELPAGQRPKSMRGVDGRVQRVCLVDASLMNVETKLKNRHWYSRGKKYLRAEFDVRTVIGNADLKFQIWSKGGVKLNSDHKAIDVKWDAPRSDSLPSTNEMTAEQRVR